MVWMGMLKHKGKKNLKPRWAMLVLFSGFTSISLRHKKCNCGGPPAYKIKHAEKDQQHFHQNLLHHYLHAKVNTIDLFFLEIQWILESHDLKDHNQRHDHALPKVIGLTSSLPSWRCIDMQKISPFHLFILEI